jgi:phosphoribosylformimino-5-aminoimidazole carboxamide ribonucleotide (ProFAR) isomerase
MRIGTSVLVHNGLAYQSYNWSIYRPLGNVQGVIDALDEYECDEIALIFPTRNDQSIASKTNDLALVKNISSTTPMSIGGGIRSVDDISHLRELPLERFIVSSAAVLNNWKLIEQLKYHFGPQAVQSILPVKYDREELYVCLCSTNKFIPLNKIDLNAIAELSNEVIIYDTNADGFMDRFKFNLISKLCLDPSKTIITGGVGPKCIKVAQKIGISACMIDNRTLHSENSINALKRHARLS